ncbi:MAG: flagellar biosynthetic protein FliR [Gammaproteobacteria bacterium]|uniref:flagellar biosynthetic protein FliR n=1 Tax=Rhodoferax sp. TaxID=50421 RepID=UPI001832326B|nr:flagellar biosynthetic protein FliR [Rhodoferax sp.]MBU3900450.1 flagellar biosynthetic protein FliR [Gammaproteobacteria bacterium]MBA3059916.1 flagellar biosynthetic protein FliR [Rhodoferax sp.]MBU3997146.1 flagellar biosynthetic protein FliR [Gammaproteobacteria bacterium]MBU4079895.1 flagellar biosynthetic protein FliR [Gammaproteobacteria bacterium]MBU4112910.1 flagellar biosynthetic protein FliR [Gammaproteobacteria bacterium]
MIELNEAQLMAWLSPMIWPFLRVLAVFTSAPLFSSRAFPLRARIGLAFFIALAAQPSLQGQPVISITGPDAFGAVMQQVGIGLAIGFTVRVVFAAVELAGEVVGFQMGLGFASFFNPALNTQSSAVARFFGHMAAFLFIVMNGHLMVLMAVLKSFEKFPVDQNFLQAVGQMRIYDLGTDLFATGLWIALPMVGMLLFANLALGIVSRVAPQMNIYAIGFPITLTVGMIGIAATLPMLDQPFMALMDRAVAIFVGK